MNEFSDLSADIETLLSDFESTPAFQRYRSLKSILEKDFHLTEIKKQRETLQQSLKFLKNEKKDEAIKICKELQIEYDNNPIVINFKEAEKELLELLKPLTETKL